MDSADEHFSATHWEHLERVFLAALEQPDDERTAFLASACALDEALHAEVAAMLAAHSSSG